MQCTGRSFGVSLAAQCTGVDVTGGRRLDEGREGYQGRVVPRFDPKPQHHVLVRTHGVHGLWLLLRVLLCASASVC